MSNTDQTVSETMVIISVNHNKEDECSVHYLARLLDGDYTRYGGKCYGEKSESPIGDEADFWNKIFVRIKFSYGYNYVEIKPGTTFIGDSYVDVVCYLLNNQKEGRKSIHIEFDY